MRKQWSRAVLLWVIAVVLLAYIAAAVHHSLYQASPAAPATASLPLRPVPESSERPVFRYSVVRGGVYSRAEVVREMQRDPVVAAHYTPIETARVHPAVAGQQSLRYVSFRKDDRVYWTRNAVRLPKGETILSDGNSEIRARCGNRLALTPQQPTLPVDVSEPTEAELANRESSVLTPELVVPSNPTSKSDTTAQIPLHPSTQPLEGLTLTPPSRLPGWPAYSADAPFGCACPGLLPPQYAPALAMDALLSEPLVLDALRPAPPSVAPVAQISVAVWPPLVLTILPPPDAPSAHLARGTPARTAVVAATQRTEQSTVAFSEAIGAIAKAFASHIRNPELPQVSDGSPSSTPGSPAIPATPTSAVPESANTLLTLAGLTLLFAAKRAFTT